MQGEGMKCKASDHYSMPKSCILHLNIKSADELKRLIDAIDDELMLYT